MQVDEKENNKMIISVLHNGCFKKVSPVQFNFRIYYGAYCMQLKLNTKF